MSDSFDVGLVTELEVQKRLISMGLEVFTPLSGRGAFDCVVHLAGGMSRVQIKTARPAEYDSIRFNTYTGSSTNRRGLTPDDCDVIVAFVPQLNECFVVTPNGKAHRDLQKSALGAAKLTSAGQLFPAAPPTRKMPGVRFRPSIGRWTAEVCKDGETGYFRSHPTYEDAAAVITKARELLDQGLSMAEVKKMVVGDTGIEPVTLRV